MLTQHARTIAALGSALGPDLVGASESLYRPYHGPEIPAGISVTRDAVYGPGKRNRLDIFSADAMDARPVLLFVHGGGFVMGDKTTPGSPYYDNVGHWAASNGFVGVTITYGLAPVARYPSGAVDLGAALGWVRANIAAYGGDPHGIVVMGHSAGAIHAATYAARPDLWSTGESGVAGLILMSGVYDFSSPEQPPNVLAYYGDRASAAAASPLAGLVASRIPLLGIVAEYDAAIFQVDAMGLTRALFERDGAFPNVLHLAGHNHITEITHLNAPGIDDELLALHIRDFAQRVTSTAAQAVRS